QPPHQVRRTGQRDPVMPIEAQLHDGTILEFPDDTPDEIVQARVHDYVRGGPSAFSRFMAPIPEAANGGARIPAAIADNAVATGEALIGRPQHLIENNVRAARGFVDSVVKPPIDLTRRAIEELGRGEYAAAARHGSAALTPLPGNASVVANIG